MNIATLTILAAACLPGGAAARTGGSSSQSPSMTVSNTQPTTRRTCPIRSQVNSELARASTLMQQASFQEASKTLQPLAEQKCDPRISLLYAAALESVGDAPGALEALEQAHASWPSNNSLAASLARAHFSSGHTDQAVAALSSFHPSTTTPLQELSLAAVVFLAGHRLVPAQAAAAVAYKSYPSVQSLLLLANTLQVQGRYKEVIALLQPERRTYQDAPAFLITMAESEYDAILYDTARDDLEHALALDQQSYQGHFLLGNALVKLGDVEKAIAEYRLAIGIAPQQPRTYYQLALALESRQDEDNAEQQLAQAIKIDNTYAPAHLEIGKILLNQNRTADAVAQLTLAVDQNPASEQGYYLLAKAYAQSGDKDKSDAMTKRLTLVRAANSRSKQTLSSASTTRQ